MQGASTHTGESQQVSEGKESRISESHSLGQIRTPLELEHWLALVTTSLVAFCGPPSRRLLTRGGSGQQRGGGGAGGGPRVGSSHYICYML